MGIPQIADRMRARPTQALRAVFSGIGRILMSADRPPTTPPSTAASTAANMAGRTAGATGQARRSLDETGNVRLLSRDDLDDGSPGDRARANEPEGPVPPSPAGPLTAPDLTAPDLTAPDLTAPDLAEPVAATAELEEPDPAALALPPALEPAQADEDDEDSAGLPLAGYDRLSLPSIRARLRSLDAGQLRVLVAYEVTHAERPDVLGMLERRIEKLETGG
jgi:hypothetical protein